MPSKDTQFRPVHGKSGKGDPTYVAWQSMRARVLNPKHRSFADYGGRGIKICDRWLSFVNFYEDMGDKPDGAQLGRIDNDGDYRPGNCRWESPKENSRNRRNTRFIEIFGETRPTIEWCEAFNIRFDTFRWRVERRGWSPVIALFAKPANKGPRGSRSA